LPRCRLSLGLAESVVSSEYFVTSETNRFSVLAKKRADIGLRKDRKLSGFNGLEELDIDAGGKRDIHQRDLFLETEFLQFLSEFANIHGIGVSSQ
jgi:hypothetical protein